MLLPKRSYALVGVALLVLTVGCATEPTAPVAVPDQSLIGTLLTRLGLLKCTPMPPASASATIGPLGGILKVGPHTLSVPPGALSAPVTITAVAPSDTVNRVQFQPAGLRFAVSAALTMSYANCNLVGVLAPKRIAYTDDALNILYYLLSLDNLLAKKVTGKLEHFSQYAVAW